MKARTRRFLSLDRFRLSTNCHLSIPIKTDSERCGTSFRGRCKGIRTEATHGARRGRERVGKSDSIKGLAQSIAKPAYLRLLTAEPASATCGARPDHRLPAHDLRRRSRAGARSPAPSGRESSIRLTPRPISGGPARPVDRSKQEKPAFDRRLQSELERLVPSWARVSGRQVLVTNGDGIIVAAVRHTAVQQSGRRQLATVPLEAGVISDAA